MITALKLSGFKAVFSASLPLGPFTLLIGRNGAGKSSALESLQWLRDSLFRGLAIATGPNTDFHDLVNRRAESIFLDIRFETVPSGVPVHYELGVEQSADRAFARPLAKYEKCVVRRTSSAVRVIRSRKDASGRGAPFRWVGTGKRPFVLRSGDELGLAYAPSVQVTGALELHDFMSRSVFLRLSPIALAQAVRSERSSRWAPILADDGRDLPELLARMDAPARKRVAARIRKIFPDVRNIRVVKVGDERHFAVGEHMRSRGGNKTYEIPSWMLSEGLRRITAIFALLELQPRPSFIAIEEIENGLDPWTVQHVIEALRDASSEVQILLTTHSPFLLDHVDVEEVIHVQRDRGDTTYERVSEIAEAVRYAGVLAPGAMYLSNVFGDESAPTSHGDDHVGGDDAE